MADVITRFKLETTQYDSKLRDAAKGLKEVAHQAELGGKGFTGFNQKAIEAARSLGTIESGANNTKDRLKDLVGSFNDAAKAYNNLSKEQQQSDFGKNLSQSLEQLQQRIKETKQELYGLSNMTSEGGGGSGFGGMMQVFGGNILTKMAEWGASLTGEVAAALNESAKLAKEAEGVQIAFRRLGRGDILDGLREATHNTVSDLELMKAAVKFNDFKLPVEELGTMLAFAQQKAKDTGQSIDYMVDSIVTGLGRKSLMILDNLGLSAAEIRDKMKETGDMTKAVGEIIREQMSKAGDYVETAADRVAKANVELNNQMLELGNTMQDVLGFSGWDELATKIKTEVVGAIQFTIETIGEAKNAWNSFMQTIGVKDKPKKDNRPTRMPDGTYWETTDSQGNVTASGRWLNGKRVQTGLGDVIVTGHTPDKSNNRTTHTPKVKTIDTSKIAFMGGDGYKWEQPQIEHQSLNDLIGEDNLRAYLGMPKGEMTRDWGKELGKVFAEYVSDPDKKKREKEKDGDKTSQEQLQGIQTMVGSLQSIVNGIQTLGIELPKELTDIIGVLQTITGIVGSIQAMQEIGTFLGIFKNGGIVPHAAGGTVAGTHYSGDVTPILANAGEVVLNRAQVGNLASSLQGGGMQNMQLSAVITGEQLRLVLNNNGRRTGRGEYVTTNFR